MLPNLETAREWPWYLTLARNYAKRVESIYERAAIELAGDPDDVDAPPLDYHWFDDRKVYNLRKGRKGTWLDQFFDDRRYERNRRLQEENDAD